MGVLQNLLALGDSILALKVELNTEMLETLKLILDAELGKLTFKLLIVTGGSLTSSFLLVPFLALGETVELVTDAAARVVVEVGEAVEVGGEDVGHLCR